MKTTGLPLQLAGCLAAALLTQGCTVRLNSTQRSANEAVQDSNSSQTAKLTWSAPTQNTDNSALTDLAGYVVSYGTQPGTYTQSLQVGNVTTYTVTGLSSGKTYYFSIRAIDTSGNLSTYATEVSKTFE